MYGVVNTIVEQPILHRSKDRLRREEYYKENGREDVFFDTLVDTGIGDDEWICDFCNKQIPVIKEDSSEQIPIFIHGSYALCDSCKKEYEGKYPEEFQVVQTCPCCKASNKLEEE